MKKSLNPNHKFVCVKCVYSTNSRKDYNKHCTTKKHKKSHNKEKIIENVEFACPKCGKTYKFRSGYQDTKKCNYVSNSIVDNDNNDNELSLNDNKKSSIENKMFKDLFREQQKQMNETINLLKESVKTNANMIPKIGNKIIIILFLLTYF